MKRLTVLVSMAVIFSLTAGSVVNAGNAEVPLRYARRNFTLAYDKSVESGIWEIARVSGLMDKWAAAYGITVELVPSKLAPESLHEFEEGKVDALTMSFLDALTGPALTGDITFVIVGGFGCDQEGIIVRGEENLHDLKWSEVLVTDSLRAKYFLYTILEVYVSIYGDRMSLEGEGQIEECADADIASAFNIYKDTYKAAVLVGSTFGSLQIERPYYVQYDSLQSIQQLVGCLAMYSKVAQENRRFVSAVTGAYYEILEMIEVGKKGPGVDEEADRLVEIMAKYCEVSPEVFRDLFFGNLDLYWSPFAAQLFVSGSPFKHDVEVIRSRCLAMTNLPEKFQNRGLDLDIDPQKLAAVGISFPDGSKVGGGKGGIHFDIASTRLVAKGQLTR